eukprot:m.10367 g.10367  ORF g.10367 m.10367 type:complete len:78 (+) comp4249_c0_seq1:1091-1324(+)
MILTFLMTCYMLIAVYQLVVKELWTQSKNLNNKWRLCKTALQIRICTRLLVRNCILPLFGPLKNVIPVTSAIILPLR